MNKLSLLVALAAFLVVGCAESTEVDTTTDDPIETEAEADTLGETMEAEMDSLGDAMEAELDTLGTAVDEAVDAPMEEGEGQ